MRARIRSRTVDGVQFGDFEDPVLDATGSWVGVSHFYPGDHKGCRCQKIDVIEHLGEGVPADIKLVNAEADTLELGDYFQGEKPLVLALA